jgi:hypothetical protein
VCSMLRFDVMSGSPLHSSLHPAHKTLSPCRFLVHSCTRSKQGYEKASLTNSVSTDKRVPTPYGNNVQSKVSV